MWSFMYLKQSHLALEQRLCCKIFCLSKIFKYCMLVRFGLWEPSCHLWLVFSSGVPMRLLVRCQKKGYGSPRFLRSSLTERMCPRGDLSTSDALWKFGDSSIISVSHNLTSGISEALSRLVRIVTALGRGRRFSFLSAQKWEWLSNESQRWGWKQGPDEMPREPR